MFSLLFINILFNLSDFSKFVLLIILVMASKQSFPQLIQVVWQNSNYVFNDGILKLTFRLYADQGVFLLLQLFLPLPYNFIFINRFFNQLFLLLFNGLVLFSRFFCDGLLQHLNVLVQLLYFNGWSPLIFLHFLLYFIYFLLLVLSILLLV